MIQYYLGLLDEPERIEAFEKAISEAVQPHDVVVDLGCGVGTFAVFAARAGARRVFGVESSPAIEFARQLVKDNGVEVELIAGDAHDVQLPERATFLIFEDFSTTFLSDSTQSLYDSVVANWMADGFRVFPQRVTLNAGPICGPTARQQVDPWHSGQTSTYGLDLSSLLAASHNTLHYFGQTEEVEFLAEPTQLLDQRLDGPMPSDWTGSAAFEITRVGQIEGLCLWHDLILNPSSVYSNQPCKSRSRTWGQAMLPLPEPWPTQTGDRLECDLAYQPGGGDGLWKWSFRLTGGGRAEPRHYTANSFAGLPMSRKRLELFQSDRVVSLTHRAELESLVLSLVDGRRTLGQIVDELTRQRPEISSALEEVLQHLDGRRAS